MVKHQETEQISNKKTGQPKITLSTGECHMACSVATGILVTVSTRNNIFTFIVSAYKGGKICNQCKRSIILNIWEFQCM